MAHRSWSRFGDMAALLRLLSVAVAASSACAADPDDPASAGSPATAAGTGPGMAGGSALGAAGGSGMLAGQAGMPGAAGTGTAGQGVASGGAGALPSTAGAPASSGAGGGAATGPQAGAGSCSDDCPHADGVEWLCRLRFMYGVNYAWHAFAGDFGGISAWNQAGVSGEAAVDTELGDMAASGVNAIRWWVWPDFRGDGVAFDAADNPTGLGGTALADLERALELAEKHDLYLMLTLFSFDNFRLTRDESGLRIRGLTPIALDPDRRRMLIDNVVTPFARAAAQSPHARRLIAWDVINEPEWAVSGASLYGDEPFDPMTDGFGAITHAQMETFVVDVVAALRVSSDALITVGGAAMKWRRAWSKVDVDFHQFHIYDWVNQYWPYTGSPQSYGVDDKPVVMGEFPWGGLSGASYATVVESWFGNRYAGALSWAYSDGARGNLAAIKAFADQQRCKTRY